MRLSEQPDWLTISAPSEEEMESMKSFLDACDLHTVCEGAECPNIGECFTNRICTFMILGSICTRNCRFCAIEHGQPEPINAHEPSAIAAATRRLNLRHAVVTTVTRDDMPDGGAGHFAATINAIRREAPEVKIEVLISDLNGSIESLHTILEARPDIVGHNVETVPRLYRMVRPGASYSRSTALLHLVSQWGNGILSKSGMMLDLGETEEQMVLIIDRAYKMGVLTHLFSFYPERGSTLENQPQPSLDQYRRIQLARYLINEGIVSTDAIKFSPQGKVIDFGIEVEPYIALGQPFMTSGCPGNDGELACNRPFGNERASEPIRNYPFLPEYHDIQNIRRQMRYGVG